MTELEFSMDFFFYKENGEKSLFFYKHLTFPDYSGGYFVSVLLADTVSFTHTPSQMMQITFLSCLQSAWNIASNVVFLFVWLNSFAAQESN